MGSPPPKNMMKFAIVLCAFLAIAAANTVPETCKFEKEVISKLSKDLSALQPKGDGECSDGEGFACIGTILQTVMDCLGHVSNPIEILTCAQEVIGAGDACYDCICWIMSYVGVNCPTQ